LRSKASTKSFAKGLGIGRMQKAIANERRAIGNRAEKIERANPAFEEFPDLLFLPAAVPRRRRNDVDVIGKFRADFCAQLFTVWTAHGIPPGGLG
jgi:hypothetical protein